VVIMIIALLIFGPSKLPEIGKGLGKAIRSFRDGTSGLDEMDETHKKNKKELEG
jgi:sec-independent protein translocase protein TatA